MTVNNAKQGPILIASALPQPQPREGELLIRVRATGVTPTELLWYPTTHTKQGGAASLHKSSTWHSRPNSATYPRHRFLLVTCRESFRQHDALVLSRWFSGYVERSLLKFIEVTQPDEIITTAHIYDHGARLRSFELLGEIRARLVSSELQHATSAASLAELA
jgi:hypothetical protein